MRFLHTMLRVRDLDEALTFWCDHLGLNIIRRTDYETGRFTLVFLGTGHADDPAAIELTHNWDVDDAYAIGRSFGHVAFAVDDIYAVCERLQRAGVRLARPPRDGRMAFVVSPDGQSVELLQAGGPLEVVEPWASMPNDGSF